VSARTPVRMLVCGSVDRRDDGAAIRAVALLRAREHGLRRRGVQVRRCEALDIEHLLDIPDGTQILIVDAAIGVAPGEIVVCDLDELIDYPSAPAPRSSHALPVGQVIGVANALSVRPLHGLFVGIGGADFGLGRRLSPRVREALPSYRAAIAGALSQLGSAAVVGYV
jgi:hydrogenase maturation protease